MNPAQKHDVRIGVIGGSGLYDMAALTDREEVRVNTPFGEPSAPYIVGTLNDRRVAFLTLDPASHHTFVIGEGRSDGSESTIKQISFRADGLAGVRAYWELVSAEAKITRYETRTHGNAWSLYFWDPEDNRVEVFADTPWHVAQPFSNPLDFSATDDEIMAMTEQLVKADASHRPFDDWRADTAKALAAEE